MAITTHLRDTLVPNPQLTPVASIAQAFIAAEFGPMRNGAAAAASAASYGAHQVSIHTGRAWINGKRMPCATSIEIMAARCDELAVKLEQERINLRARLR